MPIAWAQRYCSSVRHENLRSGARGSYKNASRASGDGPKTLNHQHTELRTIKETNLSAALPGGSPSNTPVAITKVALRLIGLPDVADAVGDLTGLGRSNVQALVRAAEKEVATRPSSEFTAVGEADREWVEGVLSRTYSNLASEPRRHLMVEGIVGAKAVAKLANEAMSPTDRRDVDAATEDVRTYLDAVSESIAFLVAEWYATNAEANRAAMSQVAGETLQTVRGIPDLIGELRKYIDSGLASALAKLDAGHLGRVEVPVSEQPEEPMTIVFEVDMTFRPTATVEELAETVGTAVLAALEDRPFEIVVSLPTLDADLAVYQDPIVIAQQKREFNGKARRLATTLTAFFSPQVEGVWSHYMKGVPDRVRVVRGIFAGQRATSAKLDVWRTEPPLANAPIWLTPDEVSAVLESVQLGHWDHLRAGAYWRAADELPRPLIIDKVMPSILAELVRRGVTADPEWPADALLLAAWHIGQG